MDRRWFTVLVLTLSCVHAQAQTSIDKGDWLIRLGGTIIDPSSSGLFVDATITDPESSEPVGVTGTVTADSDASVTFNVTYMITRNLGIELLAALPFRHNLELEGVTVGSTRLIPPTLSLQWHQPIGRVVPYVGLGLNWTEFYNERVLGSGDILRIGDSRGLAAQIGFDFVFAERWIVNGDLRYISINPDITVDGVDVGSVNVDPWTAGISLGFRFN